MYKSIEALYGLKQAPYAWFDGYFPHNGYIKSDNEPTLFVKKGGKNEFIICPCVDDIIYTSSSASLVDEFKS